MLGKTAPALPRIPAGTRLRACEILWIIPANISGARSHSMTAQCGDLIVELLILTGGPIGRFLAGSD